MGDGKGPHVGDSKGPNVREIEVESLSHEFSDSEPKGEAGN